MSPLPGAGRTLLRPDALATASEAGEPARTAPKGSGEDRHPTPAGAPQDRPGQDSAPGSLPARGGWLGCR